MINYGFSVFNIKKSCKNMKKYILITDNPFLNKNN
jgi:hypothetical protein